MVDAHTVGQVTFTIIQISLQSVRIAEREMTKVQKNRLECDCCAYGKYVKPHHIDEVTWNLCKNCSLLSIEDIRQKYSKKYWAKLGVRTRTNTILTDYQDYPSYTWMKDVYIKKIGA